MTSGYQITNQAASYYLTLQVIDWIDIFTRKIYCDIIIESLDYCRKNKRLELWAYVIMSNHIHMIVSAKNENLSDVLRDFKRHTGTKILKTIATNTESRRKWMLERFEKAASNHKRNSKYQFWTHENHALELVSHKFVCQKLACIHLNPVRASWVEKAEDWLYSSQRNYLELSNLLEIDLIDL